MSTGIVERFTTATAAPSARLAYWNALASETFNSLNIDADDPAGFAGEMMRAPLGQMTAMSARSAPACVHRTNDGERIRMRPAFDLHFQLEGRSLNRQAGREAVLEVGDFTLCDASQPYSVRFTEQNHMLCLKMPAELLAARLGDLDQLICVPMSAQRGGAAMLSAFLRSVWEQIDRANDTDGWSETVSDVILDLMALAYRPLQEEPAESSRANWRRQAHAFIHSRLCDPELGVASVAHALGVSPRYIQLLFAEAETTPSAYILNRRLDLAAERLRQGVGRGGVTQVALGVGFNDLTHFGRAFRRRFGVSPSDYCAGRRAHRWAERGANDAGEAKFAPVDLRQIGRSG